MSGRSSGHVTGVRLTIQRTLDNLSNFFRHSYSILTLQMVEINIVWEGILTVKANGRVEILKDKLILGQNSMDQLCGGGGGGAGFTLTLHLQHIHSSVWPDSSCHGIVGYLDDTEAMSMMYG